MKSFKKNLSILSEDKQKELISSKTDWAFLQALKANYEFFEKDLEIKSYRFQAYLTDIKKIEDYFINPDKISQMKSLLGETYSKAKTW
jgi:ADP-glucose pyrophosphorylase